MTLSHVIHYVKEIEKSLLFFKKAFDLETQFVHESGVYAELSTGAITLAFVSESLATLNLPKGYQKHALDEKPLGCELVFTVTNVKESYDKALRAGAVAVADPIHKPWGQEVAYVRDPNGILIEIASPMH